MSTVDFKILAGISLLGEAFKLSNWLISFLTIFFVIILKESFPSVMKVCLILCTLEVG